MWRVALLVVLLALPAAASADPKGWEAVLTEVRHGPHGGILVTRAGQSLPKPAEPLMMLNPDDQVTARADARAVVLFRGGMTQTVTLASSPFMVRWSGSEPSGALKQTVLRLFGIFSIASIPQAYVSLGARSGGATSKTPATVLRFLSSEALRLDWRAGLSGTHEVRITGEDGLDWRSPAAMPPFSYPPSAPRLSPSVFYEVTVRSATGQVVEHRIVEVVPPAERVTVGLELAAIDGSDAPAPTKALMRAGYLASLRLLPDARRELETAITARPAEPSLRMFLGRVYESLGRSDLADAQLELARALTKR